jgi:hypothetical protein
MRPIHFSAIAGMLIVLLAVPAAGHASTTFGSSLRNKPSGGHCGAPCTHVSFAAGENPVRAGSPVNGLITRSRIRATKPDPGPGWVRLRLGNVTPASLDVVVARLVGRAGPIFGVAGTGRIEEFDTRLPVNTGDDLALDTSNVDAIRAADGSRASYVFTPPMWPSKGLRGSDAAAGELLVQATVEPEDGHRPRLTKPRVRRGVVSFKLSGVARVSVRLERRDRRGRARRFKRLWVNGRQGVNSARFTRKLPRGRYRIVLGATDAPGSTSTTVTDWFRAR